MAALTGNAAITALGNPEKIKVPVNAAITFYGGSIVWGLAAGYAAKAPSAGDRPLGISCYKQVTLAQGDLIEIWVGGLFEWVTIASITIADIGSPLLMQAAGLTDNPADCVSFEDATVAANDALIGDIKSFINSKAIVKIDRMGGLSTSVTAGSATNHWI